MEFEEFKKKIVEGLQEIYGDDAEIETDVALKNNGSKYNGISIIMKDSGCRATPIVEIDSVYEAFESGRKDIGDCVWEIYHRREELKSTGEIERIADSAMEWELVKERVYPVLLSTEENQELLEKLVSTPMLDLSVVYAIRGEMLERYTTSIKISKSLLKYYGISSEQLHLQAMENLEKDGYEFQDMESLIVKMLHMEGTGAEQDDDKPEMYILTNRNKSYGAAGILNRKLLQEFAGGRDFIILPSSIHETLFVPATDDTDQSFFDDMVSEVNRTGVSVEERLSDHSYYYDARMGEIRMCA